MQNKQSFSYFFFKPKNNNRNLKLYTYHYPQLSATSIMISPPPSRNHLCSLWDAICIWFLIAMNSRQLSCLNFWEETWWFLLVRIFGLLSSSLWLLPQHFSRYVNSGTYTELWSFMQIPEFDKHLKKAGRHISRNIVEITIKMKIRVQKPLMIKSRQLSLSFV